MFRDTNLSKIFWQESGSLHFYRVSHIRFGENYVAGALTFVKDEYEMHESYPLHAKDPEQVGVEGPVKGSVWFYLDTSANIILEENSRIKRDMFGPVLSQIITKYACNYYDGYWESTGKFTFSISFDRDRTKFEKFFREIKKLTRISFTVNTPDNPFEDEFARDLAKIIEKSKTEKVDLESNKKGFEKESPLAQSTMSLTADGHFDTRLEGRDEKNFKRIHECNGKNDDAYPMGKMESNVDVFVLKAKNCLDEVEKKRSERSSNSEQIS